jgi:hypothetical protein
VVRPSPKARRLSAARLLSTTDARLRAQRAVGRHVCQSVRSRGAAHHHAQRVVVVVVDIIIIIIIVDIIVFVVVVISACST